MALELPEMHRIARQLNEVLVGTSVVEVQLAPKCAKLIEWGFVNLDTRELTGPAIERVTYRGHYVIITLADGRHLVFGDLIGKLLYHESPTEIPKDYRIKFALSNGAALTFHTSLYGFASVFDDAELAAHKYVGAKGLTPLDPGFTVDYFESMLDALGNQPAKRIQSAYDSLLGFQNGYFQEFLFCAGLLPTRKIPTFGDEDRHTLYHCILDITTRAVGLGGSSDEVDIYGRPGQYHRIMGGHLKGKPCPRCGPASTIVQKSILGSNSYFCHQCQK